MSELMKASHQWSTRPADERFVSLIDMNDHFNKRRSESREIVAPTKGLRVTPDEDNIGLNVIGPQGDGYAPTHWSFNQLTKIANLPGITPTGLRNLPSPLAADVLNYGVRFKREVEDVGLLLHRNGSSTVPAITGPKYGRIWNSDITATLISHFGNGRDGAWKVPGEFGKSVEVTKANTTLFAGDRDLFVFLADENHKIEVPNRRNGQPGFLSRGFFVWNSEVGSTSFGLGMFLFDYVCCNRIVWGAQDYQEIRIRHSVGAPDRFIEEIQPALVTYANSSGKNVTEAIEQARKTKLAADLDDFLATRFSPSRVEPIKAVHMLEEQRPIETVWDATVAATAYARSIPNQDDRVALERQAGKLLELKAAA